MQKESYLLRCQLIMFFYSGESRAPLSFHRVLSGEINCQNEIIFSTVLDTPVDVKVDFFWGHYEQMWTIQCIWSGDNHCRRAIVNPMWLRIVPYRSASRQNIFILNHVFCANQFQSAVVSSLTSNPSFFVKVRLDICLYVLQNFYKDDVNRRMWSPCRQWLMRLQKRPVAKRVHIACWPCRRQLKTSLVSKEVQLFTSVLHFRPSMAGINCPCFLASI